MGSCSDHGIADPYLWVEVNENAAAPDGAWGIDYDIPSVERGGVVGAPANETVITLTVHDNVIHDGVFMRMVTINLNRAQATKLADVLNRRLDENDAFDTP